MVKNIVKRSKGQKYRIWGSVPIETGAEIDKWYVKMGIPKTAFVSLCVQAGLKAVVRGIYPEEAFTPEQWRRIIEAPNKEGDIEKKA